MNRDLKIFTNNIEQSAKEQIDLLLEQEAFKDCKVRIMPIYRIICPISQSYCEVHLIII